MACHQRLRTTHKEGRRRAWHAIISFGQHRLSNDVGRGMPSPPLDSTHSRMTSGVACHHLLWEAQTVERCRRGMPTSPLGSTHGRTTSGVACHHRFGLADTVRWRQAWHAIIALGRQTWSNDVRRGMPSLPLGSTNGRTASGVACIHCLWPAHTVKRRRAWHAIIAFGDHTGSNDVGCCMPSSPLGSTHGRTTWGVA